MLLISSCRTGKNLLQKTYIGDRTEDEIFKAFYQRNIDYDWFNVKAVAEFDSPEIGGSGSVTLRAKKDSIVWLVGKKFSIEGFRSLITIDSIFSINRIDHTYQAESIQSIKKIFALNFEFSELQELLVGNVLLPSKESIRIIQDSIEIEISATVKDLHLKYTLDKSNLNLTMLQFADRYGNRATAQFKDYRKFGKYTLPYIRNYFFEDVNSNNYILNLEIKEVEINKAKSVIFDIPSHYERVRL